MNSLAGISSVPFVDSKSSHVFAVWHVLIRTPVGLPDDSRGEDSQHGYLSSVLTASRRHQASCKEVCAVHACVLNQKQDHGQAWKMKSGVIPVAGC